MAQFQQRFAYLLILDFEATCEENKEPDMCQEIIEFPVYAVSTSTWMIDHEFHKYIMPTVNPKLSDFCTQLTGITQEMVDQKQTLEEVIPEFDKWLEDTGIKKQSFAFVTCGDWDLKFCLPLEAEFKDINLPDYFEKWINLKKAFKEHKAFFVKDLMHMLELMKIPHRGRLHSGIDDVRNMTEIVSRLGHDKYKWKYTGKLA